MKYDLARRAALAALAALFAYLLYLCAEGGTLMKLNAEVRHGRQNMDLTIEKLADGVYYIGGEGVLYGSDMLSLVEGEGNRNAAREIIIGDGITELGYKALIEFEGLEILWLGRGMEIVDNGAIKGCTALKYVFIPRGLQECGRDFLYNCGECVVVTDGALEKLPALMNVEAERVLTGVDSYDALVTASAPEAELPEGLRRWWP